LILAEKNKFAENTNRFSNFDFKVLDMGLKSSLGSICISKYLQEL